MCYQVVAIPVDYPAKAEGDLSHENTVVIMEKAMDAIARLFETVVGKLADCGERDCVCASALEGAEG